MQFLKFHCGRGNEILNELPFEESVFVNINAPLVSNPNKPLDPSEASSVMEGLDLM